MNALQQMKAKLRRKRDRDVGAKPMSQHPPGIRTKLPSHASEICDTCTKLLVVVQKKSEERIPFPGDAAELQELPPLSCPFCYLRWRTIPPAEREKLRGCLEVDVRFFGDSQGGLISIHYSYLRSGFYSISLGCEPYTNLDLLRGIYSSSPSTFSIINNWIDTCHNKHEDCRSVFQTRLSTPSFPAGRILDIEPNGLEQSASGNIRLVDGQNLEANSKYISLSHRWGSHEPLKLTRELKGYFEKGIYPQALPKTFVDAIDITRRLGVKYLWIDSMCIIQDDEEDWKKESAKMAQIYEHAWLNIAAAKAQDAREGCYTERERWDVTPLVAHVAFRPPFYEPYFLFHSRMWDTNVQDSPLMQRAWVQQEQFFSRRILYFAQHQVFWRCQQLTACETFPDGMPEHGKGYKLYEKAHLIASLKEGELIASPDLQQRLLEECAANQYLFQQYRQKSPPEDHPQRELIETWKLNVTLLEIWSAIVGQYSGCELTYPAKDKLIAISGLARRCGRESDYLAGLWRSTLPWQLLWKVQDNREVHSKYSRLLKSPSWSWASVHRHVIMHIHLRIFGLFELDQPLIEVLKADTQLVGNDPFGQVNGGLITLAGFLLKTKISVMDAMTWNWSKGSSKKFLRQEVYCEDDLGKHSEGSLGYYLPILRNTIDREDSHTTAWEGLWLEPTGRKHGEYRRRGYFVLPLETPQFWPYEFLAEVYQILEVEEYEQYEGMHSVGDGDNPRTYHRYRITIV